jgi:hypothetical protein
MIFFGFFGGSQYEYMKQTKRHTSITLDSSMSLDLSRGTG